MGKNNYLTVALFCNAAVLLLILLVLLDRRSSVMPAAFGQAAPIGEASRIGGNNGLFVMPAQFHQSMWGCYLLDTSNRTLCTYEYDAGERTLKLTSARDFSSDVLLKNFATEPAPWEVADMVKRDQNKPVPAPGAKP